MGKQRPCPAYRSRNEEFHRLFEDGKTYVITGPSGCGKSTLLNLIAGIISPSCGEINISIENNKISLTNLSQSQKDSFRFENIGYIFQDFKLVEDFTVMDNMRMLNINGKRYTSTDFENALKIAKIESKQNKKVRFLSGGEKQRVSIARAIIKKSNIVLADEPTESLNQSLSHEVIQLLTTVARQEKKTLIMVTHDTSLTQYFDIHIDAMDFLEEAK